MAQRPVSLTLLERALDQVAATMAGTKPDQAGLRTPCRSWTVQQLVEHLIGDLGNFAARVRGEKPQWGQAPPPVEGPWVDAFATARAGLEDAWDRADLDALVPTMSGEAPLVSQADQQVAELGVHAWDLARATGQDIDLDADVAAYGLQWATRNLAAQFRGTEEEGKAFGPEVPVPADAPVYERLAGWFGRDPHWS